MAAIEMKQRKRVTGKNIPEPFMSGCFIKKSFSLLCVKQKKRTHQAYVKLFKQLEL
jgi:hypothetical protein